MRRSRLICMAIACLLALASPASAQPEHVDVFVSGREGYHTFRIPSVVVTQEGTVLAFAEGRASRSDHAQNDIVLKLLHDGFELLHDFRRHHGMAG